MSRGKAASQRQLRVGEELRHALARILARASFRDPALEGAVITVTEVRSTPDLRSARAFVVPLGGGDAKAMAAALNRAQGYLRGELGREITLRHTPTLVFEADSSFDAAQRIEEALRRPGVQRDLHHDEPDGDDPEG